MIFKYRKILTGKELIKAGESYSFVYTIDAPELSEETLKLALDLLVDSLKYNYAVKDVTYILWKDPAYSEMELLFTWTETPGTTLNWFSDQVKVWAREYYIDLDLKEVAVFLPRFPWWLLALLGLLGAVAVGSAVKKKKKGG